MPSWFLTIRYLCKKPVAWIALCSVALLVLAAVVVLSIMGGLLHEARQANHAWAGDVVIARDSLVGFGHYQAFMDLLSADPLIDAATAVITTFGLSESHGPVRLIGVDLRSFCRVTGFRDMLSSPELADAPALRRIYGADPCSVVDGAVVCHYSSVDVYAHGGGSWPVTLVPLSSTGLPLRGGVPMAHRFSVRCTARTALMDIDADCLIVDFDVLQRLTAMDGSDGFAPRTSEIRIALAHGVSLESGVEHIAARWRTFVTERTAADPIAARLLNDVHVTDWKTDRQAMIAPVENERSMMAAMFCLLALAAVAIVLVIFHMIVSEKTVDLAVLKTLGASSGSLAGIFLLYSVFIGTGGVLLGTAGGVAIVTHANAIESAINTLSTRWGMGGFVLWDPEVFAISRIPERIEWSWILGIALGALIACICGAVIPALRAARLGVVNILRWGT